MYTRSEIYAGLSFIVVVVVFSSTALYEAGHISRESKWVNKLFFMLD